MSNRRMGANPPTHEEARNSPTLERQRAALAILDELGLSMTPVAMDNAIKEAVHESLGVFDVFCEQFRYLARRAGIHRKLSELDQHFGPKYKQGELDMSKPSPFPPKQDKADQPAQDEDNEQFIADKDAEIERLETIVRTYETKIKELQAQSAPATHTEAREVAWTSALINGFEISITAREGCTPETIAATTLSLLAGLRLLFTDETVKEFGAVIGGKQINRMKGGQKQQASSQQDKPATPKGNAAPPAGKPPAGKSSQPPAESSGKTGKPGSMRVTAITKITNTRWEIEGLLDNGNPMDHALELKDKKAGVLVKALQDVGYDPLSAEWEADVRYPFNAIQHWIYGKETAVGSGKYWHDQESWEILTLPE